MQTDDTAGDLARTVPLKVAPDVADPMSGGRPSRRRYGETVRDMRKRWKSEGKCRDCGASDPRLPDGRI